MIVAKNNPHINSKKDLKLSHAVWQLRHHSRIVNRDSSEDGKRGVKNESEKL